MLNDMPEVLTASEVADYLRVSRATVYEMVRTGRLRSIQAGAGRQGATWIPIEALKDFLAGRTNSPNID